MHVRTQLSGGKEDSLDLRLLEYMVAIEQYGNITEAADRLYLTPSALNQQLLKLEREIGTPLFVRSKRRMIPTEAGAAYIDASRRMLSIRQQTYAALQDIASCYTGTCRVGLTYDHGSSVFARIYPVFHRRYPGMQMRCYQMLVPEMLEQLQNGELDLVFLLGDRDADWPGMDTVLLSEENLLLGVPRSHPLAADAPYSDTPLPAFDLRRLQDENFSLALKKSTMRSQLIDPLFQAAGFQPSIMVESSFNNFLQELAAQGICCTIIPQSQVTNRTDVVWYYLQNTPRFRFSVAYSHGYRLNNALQFFIELAREDARLHLEFAPPEAALPTQPQNQGETP